MVEHVFYFFLLQSKNIKYISFISTTQNREQEHLNKTFFVKSGDILENKESVRWESKGHYAEGGKKLVGGLRGVL